MQQEQRDENRAPFALTLQDVTVVNAVSGVAFLNAGGELAATDVRFTNSNLAAAISTGPANPNTVGTSIVNGIRASGGRIMVSLCEGISW